MLGIRTASGEFLDLAPGTAAQLERTSPFFNAEDLAGEYTLPLSFPYTPKNAREMGLPNHYYTRRIKTIIPAWIYDNNNFSYAGDLIIETAELDVNDIGKSKINGYFLTGVSSFFQLVKKKKLKELELGGVRSFAWTNNNPDSPVKGFWQHIHETLDGSRDYSFAPIANENWSGSTEEGTADWMNKLDENANLDYSNNYNTLAPQVKLKYLLDRVFSEHGWTFDYSGMGDTQWETLFLPSFFALTWQKIIQVEDDPFFAYSPLTNISLNLQNHVPPEMFVTDLILALRYRYNWGFNFDSGKKVCSMIPLKGLANGTKKDWTPYMSGKWQSNFAEDPKTFAFKNEIDSNDGISSSPDFSKVTYGDPVIDFSELPTAAEENFNLVVFCWKENQFYQCRYNEDDDIYEWALFADNIYDYDPEGSNEEISTVASTMPVYKRFFRNNGVTDYYGFFPLCQQEGNWEGKNGEFVPWGLRLLFHRGRVWEANPAGNQGTLKYPYLTSICTTITQVEDDLEWSNVYRHEFDGIDKGIIKYWFNETMRYLAQSDVITGTLILPRQELMEFVWSDIILMRNIPYVMQKITEVIPYPNTVRVEARRIG